MRFSRRYNELPEELWFMDPPALESLKARIANSETCGACERFEQAGPVRIFLSEDHFRKSIYYGGGDIVVGDPHGAKRAAWVGKNNVGRNQAAWWICTPVHPYCACELNPFDPLGAEEEYDDKWFAEQNTEQYSTDPAT